MSNFSDLRADSQMESLQDEIAGKLVGDEDIDFPDL